MKHPMCLVFLAALALPLASCHSPLVPPPKSIPNQSDPISDQVHASVNQYRMSLGKRALSRHNGLDRLAAEHSRFLLLNSGSFTLHGKKVSHYGFDNRVFVARRMYSMSTLGENVAAGHVKNSQAGTSLLNMWKNSKDHHKQLLEDWIYTGIGSVTGLDGTVYCTQIFATPNTSSRQSLERFGPP